MGDYSIMFQRPEEFFVNFFLYFKNTPPDQSYRVQQTRSFLVNQLRLVETQIVRETLRSEEEIKQREWKTWS